jgi:hypothetical protein
MSEYSRLIEIEEKYRQNYGVVNENNSSYACYPFDCKDYLLDWMVPEVDAVLNTAGIQPGLVIDFGSGGGITLQNLCEHFKVPGLGLEIRQEYVDYARRFGGYIADNHGLNRQVDFKRCNIIPGSLIPNIKETASSFIHSQMPCPDLTEIESDSFYDPTTLLYLYGYNTYQFVLTGYLLNKMAQQQILMIPGINFRPDYGFTQQLEQLRQESEFDFYDNRGGTVIVKR